MQFANPWGLLALLGIPAVLIIHALRRNPKPFLTNTLFLIETRLRDPGGGRRLRRLRRSAQLWLRLLLVVLITWALARPVTVREDSTQRIVLVIDSSASMSAARELLVPALRAAATPWIRQTAHTEWIALSSIPDAPPIHRGWDDFDSLAEKLGEWGPRHGNHDPASSIDLARGLASDHGRAIFISDHLPDPAPPGIGVLAIGSPIENVGWCGVDASPDGSWKAILRNYSDTPQQRTLTQADGSPVEIDLAPGEWRELGGILPAGSSSATMSLAEDRFALDDTLYLTRPHHKAFSWTGISPPQTLRRLFAASGLTESPDPASADLEVRTNDLAPTTADHARLLLPGGPVADAPYVSTPATATAHPFTEGLIFDALLWRQSAPINPPASDDTVLLWSGADPLAILRNHALTLELGFHPDLANFDRVPAALVLIQRWINSLRDAKVAPESLQLATGDRFLLATDAAGRSLTSDSPDGVSDIAPAALVSIIAPRSPGMLTINQDGSTLLEAAVNFVDPIESDFRGADAGVIAPPEPASAVEEATRPDRFRDLWLLLAIATLLLSWTFPETTPTPKPSPT